MAIDNERVRALADLLDSATKAYEKGMRINDTMTVAEARWLHTGRLMAEALGRAKPRDPMVIDASDHFRGDRT